MADTLHILLDPSGAYLCLDYSLVCSHLESLFTRIVVSLERGDKLVRIEDEEKWKAYVLGKPVERRAVWLPSGCVDACVRQTQRHLIMPRKN